MGSHSHSDRRRFLQGGGALASFLMGAVRSVRGQTPAPAAILKDDLTYGQPSRFDNNGGGLARGIVPLGNAKPVKIAFSLVPFATTVWDFINRAMPQSKPGSLSANEVYAATAYVLYRNDIIKETDVLDATTLPKVRMPNRDNFIPAQPGWKPGEKRPFGYYP